MTLNTRGEAMGIHLICYILRRYRLEDHSMTVISDSSPKGPASPALWPIFICYRQTDGLQAARRLHELLDKHETAGPKGEPIRFDVYLDQTMPAVADWREL